MTGSKAQWYNGILLLFVFFACRLVWGTWQSICVYMDMWKATTQIWHGLDPINIKASVFQLRDETFCIDEACAKANAELSRFSHQIDNGLPLWLSLTYVISNIVLNGLNYYWFSKMIETVLKRFRDPDASSKTIEGKISAKNMVPNAAPKSEEEDGFFGANQQQEKSLLAVNDGVEEVLRRRKA
jgi:TLC domain